MAITKLYSKRQKELRGEVPDIYIYDEIPKALRIQIMYLIKDSFGFGESSNDLYEYIYDTLCREYGRIYLVEEVSHNSYNQVLEFLLRTTNVEEALDVIELSFEMILFIKNKFPNYHNQNSDVKIKPDEAISDLNNRFKEHGIGYVFEEDKIIRIDSEYIHSQITKPTISLLWNEKFSGANEEYLKAHEHYRYGRNKECLSNCLNAFESTMKTICNEKGWEFKKKDSSSKLIKICFDNNLIPSFTENQFSSLKQLLSTGIPTIRNKLSGHGQGQVPQKVDDEITRYALNLTGSNIIFLIEQSGI